MQGYYDSYSWRETFPTCEVDEWVSDREPEEYIADDDADG